MGVNFTMDFTYSVSNKLRGFKSSDSSSIEAIGNYLKFFTKDDLLFEGLKDFNMLVALGTNDTLPLKVRTIKFFQFIDADPLPLVVFKFAARVCQTK